MYKTCKHCKETLEFEKVQQFGAHVRNCKSNPKYKEYNKKVSEALIKAIEHNLICKCGNPYTIFVTKEQFEKGNYAKHCCRACANRSKDIKRKRSYKEGKRSFDFSHLSQETRNRMTEKASKAFQEKCRIEFLSKSWDKLSIELKKRRVLIEQENKCLSCGISTEWNGKPLVLHLDHIDGNRENNSIENLRCLCPNCHSQTETWSRIKGGHSSIL